MAGDAPVVGVDLGGTKLLLLARSAGQETVERLPTGPLFRPAQLEEAVQRFLASLPQPPAALGLAIPGLVDADGRVEACDVLERFTGWTPEALRQGPWAFAALNDADAALAGETDGTETSAALVVVGTGIGAAFVLNGRPFRGGRGWGGELGSVPVATSDGVRTLDQLASGDALVRRLGRDGAAIARDAAAGDPQVRAAITEAGEALGLGLAAILHLLNPTELVLGGGVVALPGYRAAALRSAEAGTLRALWRACQVREFRHGDRAAAIGAARSAERRARA
jgi:glucokinase